jgi:hypothetical protein
MSRPETAIPISPLPSDQAKAPIEFTHSKDGRNGFVLKLFGDLLDQAHQRDERYGGVGKDIRASRAALLDQDIN